MEKEIKVLSEAIKEPKRPFVVILGGAKVETKISILKKFVQKADSIIVGGAMAYTFLYAMGQNIGTSICHQESVEVAKEIIEEVKKTGKKLLLPVDHIVMRDTDRTKTPFYAKKMVGDMAGYDIGVETVSLFSEEIAKAGQIFWNGPMGMFEDDKFKSGTQAIANAVASSPAYTIAGGGDTVNAIHEFGLGKKINYLSTGGGATMKFLEKGTLPALEVIQEKIR